MKRVVFLFCILALTAAGACSSVPQGGQVPNPSAVCPGGKCDALTEFEVDLDALNDNWPGPRMESVEDAHRVTVKIGDQTLVADTHLFGDELRVIPYHNDDNIQDVDGNTIARGDAVIAAYFPPGEIGIGIKHHRPSHRVL